MKAIKFRIKNYKSIEDSGDCYFAEKFTILAGKNESGKTSILEALADFHEKAQIGSDKVMIDSSENPSIEVTFLVDKEDIIELLKEHKIKLAPKKKKYNITIIKKYPENKYSMYSIIEDDGLIGEILGHHSDKVKTVKILVKKVSIDLADEIEGEDDIANKIYIIGNVISSKAYNKNGQTVALSEDETAILFDAQQRLIDSQKSEAEVNEKITTAFVDKMLPYFIMFSSFDDIFPDSIKIADLKESPWAKDLEQVSSFRIEKISSDNKSQQINHQAKANADFTEKFSKYWTQDAITLEIDKDGDTLYFWIVEGENRYRPSQRSKGQQWYLSFYIKVVARIVDNRPNLILIDEPGLFLHAKAQKDILAVLSDQIFNYPVVFSTHSPYLISEESLSDTRLVEKVHNKTKIIGTPWSGISDGETLTPVLTAIGLGVNDSITNLDQKFNIVAEGIEETLYLRAFRHLTSRTGERKLNIISGGGASQNMGRIGSILEGWGCTVCYVFDHDSAGANGVKKLKANGVDEELLYFVSEAEDCATVDLLSRNDFRKYVIDQPNINDDISNSRYFIKHKEVNKTLSAKLFFDKTMKGEVKLDSESIENINNFFNKLNLQ